MFCSKVNLRLPTNRFVLFAQKQNMKKAIAYYRVSTRRQQLSGLGLDAQQKAVRDFAGSEQFTLIEEFTERRSGMRIGNPQLSHALSECHKHDAVLLIAKLDRLKRNVAFIAALMESCVQFITVDDPFAEEFTLHIKAAVGQKEGRDISKRTKDALAAAKRRGTELGKNGRYVLSILNKQQADDFALRLMPVIDGLYREGITTIREITRELNRRHVPTSQNAHWHISTVCNLIKRFTNNQKH